jgi:hypothetical protein
MSSILTNNSAMVALQTLKSVNSNLADTQSQISTGKKSCRRQGQRSSLGHLKNDGIRRSELQNHFRVALFG